MSGRGCDEIRALLPAQLDGDLDPTAAARVREHLEGCPDCREQRETLRLAVDALRRLPELPPPASILAGVRARLRPVPWHRRLFARRPWLVGVPVGALATAIVALGVALFQARYPQLPRVAEQRTAVPPAGTHETRSDTPELQRGPQAQAPPKAGRDTSTGSTPVPVARKGPAPPAATTRKPAATPERAVIVQRPEPPAAAPAAPAASLAPSPPAVPAQPEAPPTRIVRTEDATSPATRFAVPQPAPEPRQVAAVPRGEAAPAARQFAIPQPPPVPQQVAGEPQGEAARREPTVAPFLETARRSIAGAPGTGLLKAAAPLPTTAQQPEPPAAVPVPENIEALTVLLAAGEDFDEMRRLILRGGGRIVETRVLDPRARREALAPHRSRAGVRGEVSQGWKLSVRMPRHAIPGFADELERRPGRLVLDRRSRPAAAEPRTTGEQTLRITVLR